jgi:hypothetical protein
MSEYISVTCNSCGCRLRAPAAAIGRIGTCGQCKTKITIAPSSIHSSPAILSHPPEAQDNSLSDVETPAQDVARIASTSEPEETAEQVPSQARGRAPRKELYSADRLMQLIGKIDESRRRAMELHVAMTDADIPNVLVDGHTMALRGINQLESFIDNASRAIREAKRQKD